jgi:hypothetical protein
VSELKAAAVLRGVRDVLVQLRMVSEAPASVALDASDKVSHGPSDSRPPPRVDSLFDRHVEALEEWLVRATFALERHQYRAPMREREDDPQWEARVVSQYAGRRDLEAAKRESVSVTLIRRARAKAGRDPLYGNRL